MSIINEALKKAVREKEAGFSVQDREVVRRKLEVEFQRKGPVLNWGPIFILLVLVLITGPIVAPLFSTPFKNANYPGNLSSRPASQNIPAQPAAEVANLPASTPDATRKAQFAVEESPVFGGSPILNVSRMPDLSLSGIVYSPKESYCIINNKIVKVGDTVLGAKLVDVSRTTVKLNYQGQELQLSVGSE